MMPAGKYYVGDLCYVMRPQWNEFCDITISDNQVLDGEFNLKNGVRFATFGTMHGDGSYEDNFGNSYSVDAGLIGCILVSDIDDPKAEENFPLGCIHEFDAPFIPSSENGKIWFEQVCINTDWNDDPEDEEDDE